MMHPMINGGKIRNGIKSKSISTKTYTLMLYKEECLSFINSGRSSKKVVSADKDENPKKDTIKNKHPIRLCKSSKSLVGLLFDGLTIKVVL